MLRVNIFKLCFMQTMDSAHPLAFISNMILSLGVFNIKVHPTHYSKLICTHFKLRLDCVLPSGLCFYVIHLDHRPGVALDRWARVNGKIIYDVRQSWVAYVLHGTPQAANMHSSMTQYPLYTCKLRSILPWYESSLLIMPLAMVCGHLSSLFLHAKSESILQWYGSSLSIASNNRMGPYPYNFYSLNSKDVLPIILATLRLVHCK